MYNLVVIGVSQATTENQMDKNINNDMETSIQDVGFRTISYTGEPN